MANALFIYSNQHAEKVGKILEIASSCGTARCRVPAVKTMNTAGNPEGRRGSSTAGMAGRPAPHPDRIFSKGSVIPYTPFPVPLVEMNWPNGDNRPLLRDPGNPFFPSTGSWTADSSLQVTAFTQGALRAMFDYRLSGCRCDPCAPGSCQLHESSFL